MRIYRWREMPSVDSVRAEASAQSFPCPPRHSSVLVSPTPLFVALPLFIPAPRTLALSPVLLLLLLPAFFLFLFLNFFLILALFLVRLLRGCFLLFLLWWFFLL